MPRKTPDTEEKPQTVEDKLDEIILYLHRMERRDHMRMIGGYIHTMFWLISVLFLVWSTWYFAVYGPQLIEDLSNQMIQQSMGIQPEKTSDSQNSGGYMQMLEDYMKGQ
jgi:hypothetical protein